MRFALFALVVLALASSVFAEASVDNKLVEKATIPRPGTLVIPLPVGKPAPAPVAPKPAPAPVKISPPGTLKIWWKKLSKRISIGTIRLPLPVGPVKGAPAPAPKPAPAPVKVTPPGTIDIIRVWRKLMKRLSIGSLKIPLPVLPKAPAPKSPPPPPPKPAPITKPGTINLPLGWHKRSLSSCTGSTIACPVPGLLHGFDCVDIATDVRQCGDCQVLGGVDCSSLPGVDTVSCRNGFCHVESCENGWSYDFRKRSCVHSPKFFTQ
ncbi:hypothetical protein JCM5353_001312 [Sporobolomyces roseus]